MFKIFTKIQKKCYLISETQKNSITTSSCGHCFSENITISLRSETGTKLCECHRFIRLISVAQSILCIMKMLIGCQEYLMWCAYCLCRYNEALMESRLVFECIDVWVYVSRTMTQNAHPTGWLSALFKEQPILIKTSPYL